MIFVRNGCRLIELPKYYFNVLLLKQYFYIVLCLDLHAAEENARREKHVTFFKLNFLLLLLGILLDFHKMFKLKVCKMFYMVNCKTSPFQ